MLQNSHGATAEHLRDVRQSGPTEQFALCRLLSLSCHLCTGGVRCTVRGESPLLPPTHAAAVLIDGSRAPSSCETLSAFFPTLASANSSEDSPIGRGADR